MDWLSPFFDGEGKRKGRTDPIFSKALQEMTVWINQMDVAKLQALSVLFSSEVVGSSTRSRFTNSLKATLSICLLSNTNEGEIYTEDQRTDLYNRLTPEVNRWMAEEWLTSRIKRETVNLLVCETFVLLVSTITPSLFCYATPGSAIHDTNNNTFTGGQRFHNNAGIRESGNTPHRGPLGATGSIQPGYAHRRSDIINPTEGHCYLHSRM